ncbi:hypothetical protein O181_003982 [Austropuccinia psidii MF-1]|uniref:Uncharacterized protein n=1 Tax=Austropuccinia psidii MF-1 TaxID=1389203 RepID=A0A9Q3BFW2_9BASI|nr:hypothetical protein [Austropuccinia psidii MF-1]
MARKAFIYLKTGMIQNLAHQTLSQMLEKTSNVKPLTITNYLKQQNSIYFAFKMQSLDFFLDSNWINKFPRDAVEEEEADIFWEGCESIFYLLVSHLDEENVNKFHNQNSIDFNLATLWERIKQHYAATLVENCSNIITKIFNLRMDEQSVLATLNEFQYIFVANNMYQSPKMSGNMPTLEEIFSQIELAMARQGESVIKEETLALRVQGKKARCFGGKHNPMEPHQELECFHLSPEEKEVFFNRLKKRKEEEKSSEPHAYAIYSASIVDKSTILYSGASFSLFKNAEKFISLRKMNIRLQLANRKTIMAEALGTPVVLSDSGFPIYLKNPLAVPSITSLLIEYSPFLKKNCCLKAEGNVAKLYSEIEELFFNGKIVDNIIKTKVLSPVAESETVNADPLILHQALGNPSERYASALYPLVNLLGIKCEACLKSKSHRLPFRGTFPVLSYPFKVVHMDLCGPITPKS